VADSIQPILDEHTQGFPTVLLYMFFLEHEEATLSTLEELTLMKSDSINDHLSKLARKSFFAIEYIKVNGKVRVKFTVTPLGRRLLAHRLDKSIYDGVLNNRPTFKVNFNEVREYAEGLVKPYFSEKKSHGK
jgi:DNA-binding PadR family transcriptional regulator